MELWERLISRLLLKCDRGLDRMVVPMAYGMVLIVDTLVSVFTLLFQLSTLMFSLMLVSLQ